MDLWPKQQEALDLIVPAKRVIYGDAAGAGKTRTAHAALHEWGSRRALILVPDLDLILPQWVGEIAATGHLLPINGAGTAAARSRAREQVAASPGPAALVLNYHSAWRDVDELMKLGFDTLVCDEAHHLKDPKSATFKGIRLLARRATYLILITGTPILNGGEEAWPLLHLIDHKRWSSRTRWEGQHFEIEVTDFWGKLLRPVRLVGDLLPGHAEIVKAELGGHLIQRPYEYLFPDTPPIDYRKIEVELTADERQLYEDMRRKKWARIDGKAVVAVNRVSQLVRLRQMASEWRTLSNAMPNPGAKVQAAVDLIESRPAEQFVVLVGFKETGRQLEDRLSDWVELVDGDVKRSDRRDKLETFIDGDARVLIGTTPVLGEGVDGMQVASNVVLLDRDWTPARNEQIVRRVARGGKLEPVTAWNIHARDTVDDLIAETLSAKEAIVRSVT